MSDKNIIIEYIRWSTATHPLPGRRKICSHLQQVLDDFLFAPVPSLEQEQEQVWRWQQTRNELLVEFLTPSFEKDEGIRPLPSLGVDAHSLHHLNYLIAEPVPAIAVSRIGIFVQVPRPGELKEAYDDALSIAPKWGQRIEQSLKRLPQSSEILGSL